MNLPPPFKIFLDNYRHINYWISNAEWPDIGGGEEFFTEAVEVNRNSSYNLYVNFVGSTVLL
jgi:hypothetical protein